jgi:hypothetical protein
MITAVSGRPTVQEMKELIARYAKEVGEPVLFTYGGYVHIGEAKHTIWQAFQIASDYF